MRFLFLIYTLIGEGFASSVSPATPELPFDLSILKPPEVTSAMRGKALAAELGCFGCHGPAGSGGVADPSSPSGSVPGWDSGTVAMYIKSETDIREYILYGGLVSRQDQADPDRNGGKFIPMPAYEDQLTKEELNDLVAYFKAVSGWAPGIPDEAYEGWKICDRYGCFGCHGPSGMGAMKNPGSFKGHIPAWDGEEYEELVQTQEELREWILDGKISRLWNNPAARIFLMRQKTKMPAYREHLSQLEVDRIVAYIHWLRGKNDE